MVPVPFAAAIVAVLVVAVGFLLYRGITGGTVGDGRAGNVEASPPMPNAAKQDMIQQHMPRR